MTPPSSIYRYAEGHYGKLALFTNTSPHVLEPSCWDDGVTGRRILLQPQVKVGLDFNGTLFLNFRDLRFDKDNPGIHANVLGVEFAHFTVLPVGSDSSKQGQCKIGHHAPGFTPPGPVPVLLSSIRFRATPSAQQLH